MANGDIVQSVDNHLVADWNTNVTSHTSGTLGATPTVGNTLFMAVNSSAVINTPSGWVLDTQCHITQNNDMRLFRRTVQSGDGTSYGITLTASRPAGIWLFELAGVAALDSQSTAKTYSGAAVSALATNSVTTVAAATVLIALVSSERTGVATFSSWTNGFTDEIDLAPNGGTVPYGFSVAYVKESSQGTYSTTATLTTGTVTVYDTILVAYSFGGGGGGGGSGAQYVGIVN
jgi:hypothetical protein